MVMLRGSKHKAIDVLKFPKSPRLELITFFLKEINKSYLTVAATSDFSSIVNLISKTRLLVKGPAQITPVFVEVKFF
jgi:selenophosphate synthetase-related protein